MRRMLIGMSQERLGDQLGLTFQQVQKYEKGANRIGASRLYQIARTLDVPVDYFYDGLELADTDQETGFSEAPVSSFNLDMLSTSEGIQLNSTFFAIADPEIRKRLLDLMKVMAEQSVATGDPDGGAA